LVVVANGSGVQVNSGDSIQIIGGSYQGLTHLDGVR